MVPRHSYRGLWVITSYHYSDLRIHRNRIRRTRMIYHEAAHDYLHAHGQLVSLAHAHAPAHVQYL